MDFDKAMIELAKPSFDDAEEQAVRRVLRSGWVVQGPEVEEFEKALAGIHRVRHAVAVSSGTAALHVGYLALGIGPGDAVFVPSFAWPSAANMATLVGARVVFVDVRPDTYNMDPRDLRTRIRECLDRKWGSPRLVVPVHEFGLAAEMDELAAVGREFSLEILEDAACALGASYRGEPVGGKSRLSILSFHPRKAVTTGEGGAILTNDGALAEACRRWRNQGQALRDGRRDMVVAGPNYRMTDLHAAIGRAQLEKLPSILGRRRSVAELYGRSLAGIGRLSLPVDFPEHTWQTYMVVPEASLSREDLLKGLAQKGIGAGVGSLAGHCMQVHQSRWGYRDNDLPVSNRLYQQGMALPIHSGLSDDDVRLVTGEVRRLLEGRGGS
jgi:perosamine synthetase